MFALPKKWKTREKMWDWIYDPNNELEVTRLLAMLTEAERQYLVDEMYKEAYRKRFYNNVSAIGGLALPVIFGTMSYLFFDSFNNR